MATGNQVFRLIALATLQSEADLNENDVDARSIFEYTPSPISLNASPTATNAMHLRDEPTAIGTNIDELKEIKVPMQDEVLSQSHVMRRANTSEDFDQEAAITAEQSEQLHSLFDLPENEICLEEHPCWLIRSILLEGVMFLTTNCICFYSSLPKDSNSFKKEGWIAKRSKSKVYYNYWMVLQNDVATLFESSKELYYPLSRVDLKTCSSIQKSKKRPNSFKLCCISGKRHYFQAESEHAASDWIKALEIVIFTSKTEGDAVRIVLPYITITQIQLTKAFVFTNAICIRIIDDETSTEDEYFFANFDNSTQVFNSIAIHVPEKVVKSLSTELDDSNRNTVSLPQSGSHDSLSVAATKNSGSTTPLLLQKMASLLSRRNSRQDLTTSHPSNSSTSASPVLGQTTVNTLTAGPGLGSGYRLLTRSQSRNDVQLQENVIANSNPTSNSIASRYISWFRFGQGQVVVGPPSPSQTEFQLVEKELMSKFALPQTECLVEYFSCYLVKTVPRLGRLFISSKHLGFLSRVVGIQTKILIPLRDIQETKLEPAFGILYYGLYILTADQNEFYFEFYGAETRARCFELLNNTFTASSKPRLSGSQLSSTNLRRYSLIMTEIHRRDRRFPEFLTAEQMGQLPPVLSFSPTKPKQSLHITCLTIGTRGDVQPYIALCKGLQKDGHRCRIATHGEYKSWIEKHQIEHAFIGGDPAELISLCVENGMFSVSFVTEGMKRFRGWIDELLDTAWKACQGTDVLIESPTAMAGAHIAEKLRIPYYAAFPMPWTRTRFYPHPFAVPEINMGGGYNYMTYLLIEQVFWIGIAKQVNKWRKEILNLPATSITTTDELKAPMLYSFSPLVVPPPSDWHSRIHTTGYWFLDNPDVDWQPPSEMLAFLDARPGKTVYIGFGSIVVSDPDALTRAVVEAVRKSGLQAILSKGWSARKDSKLTNPTETSQLDSFPDFIYPVQSVPHDWLFPKMAAVVHHGGAGTTAAGIRAGIPTIIHPFFGDQYFWASQVQSLGVGCSVRKLNVERLASALIQVTQDEKIIERARLLGERVRRERGVETAIQCLYRDIDYATELMQNNDNLVNLTIAPQGNDQN